MNDFHLLVFWISSMIVGTIMGYERGRWETGFVLGLLGGPVGAIAAGLLRPSPRWEVERRKLLDLHDKQLNSERSAKRKERRQQVAAMKELYADLESQMQDNQFDFAQGLEMLASRLEEVIAAQPQYDSQLRVWVEWLGNHSVQVRSIVGESSAKT